MNSTPTFFEYAWLHGALVPGLDARNLNDRSLYRTLQDEYNLRPGGGKQWFSAIAAGLKVARALRIRPGAPVLKVVRKLDLLRVGGPITTTHSGSMFVELYAAQGPFLLEQSIPATNAYGSDADHPAVSNQQPVMEGKS